MQIDRRVFVTMSDGTRIAVTVYLPHEFDSPLPTIVESLPYRKDDDCTARDYSTYAYLAAQGFAGVRIDVRGTGASTGIIENEYLPVEQNDNVEVLDWIVAQPWSNGNVGMWGISWGGFSSLQTAMLRPPQLKAIAAMHATHDRFGCDVHYIGGSLHAAEQADWPPSMITTNALPPDPDIVGDGWKDEWLYRLENTPQWPLEWLKHQSRDDFWKHGSPSNDYQAIVCPTLLIGGWLDGYVDGMLDLAENLACPRRTVIGPWGHYRPATGHPGPTYDHLDLMARWFGHHLRGDDNDVMEMPAVTAFIRTDTPYDPPEGEVDGYWRAEPAWPPSDAASLIYRLGELATGEMTWSGPQWVGAHAPAWDRSGMSSGDSARDDGNSMVFETTPLDVELEILGTPELTATVTTDRAYGLVSARLLVVAPDGSSHLITRGSRNLAFPETFETGRPPVPGESLQVTFPLIGTSAVVPAGHRLRLAVSGADFPVVWPPPGRFTLTIDPEGSLLKIPAVKRDRKANSLALAPVPPPPTPPVEFIEDDSNWSINREDGSTVFSRGVRSRQFQPTRADLTYTSDQSWAVDVEDDDPGTTTVRSTSELSLSRPGWDIDVRGTLEISGSVDLITRIELAARHDGVEVFHRIWEESTPRVRA
jgi:uncharacterized protein